MNDAAELYQHVVSSIYENLELLEQHVDLIAPEIVDAGDLLAHTLVSDAKIFCCGGGTHAALASYFSATMISRLEHERPGLPVLCLPNDATSFAAISSDYSINEIYARPLRALGQPGDLLLVLSDGSSISALVQAVSAAHERQMSVIAITSGSHEAVASVLTEEDIEIPLPSDHRALLAELQLLTLNSLADVVEQQLFGGV